MIQNIKPSSMNGDRSILDRGNRSSAKPSALSRHRTSNTGPNSSTNNAFIMPQVDMSKEEYIRKGKGVEEDVFRLQPVRDRRVTSNAGLLRKQQNEKAHPPPFGTSLRFHSTAKGK